MSLTLITNPVGSEGQAVFAGYRPIEFEFKREDLAIINTASGIDGKLLINHSGDLTSYLSVGDSIYIYSEGINYTYDGSFDVISIVAGEITVNTDYIESSTGGYINYFKNYYVEMQLVDEDITTANLLTFSLQSDGDASGVVKIDVSIINDKLSQRDSGISKKIITNNSVQFLVKYRQVYQGSSESFTIINDKLVIVAHAIDAPEENVVINNLDVPKIYKGYDNAIAIFNTRLTGSPKVYITYTEKTINKENIAYSNLGFLEPTSAGYLLYNWASDRYNFSGTKYIEFDVAVESLFDFEDGDFAYPDFITQ